MERSFPKLNGDTLFVRIRRELELQRPFEVHQLKEKRSLLRPKRGRGPASRKEQPFSVVIVSRIALDSMDEATRKKKPVDSRRTSFVAVPQTENGRVLSWSADNLPSFAFCHVSQKFEELLHRAFHDWMRSG